MKPLAFVVVALAATAAAPVQAQPRGASTTRVGLLADFAFAEGSTRLPDAAGSQLGQIAAWGLENFDGLIVIDGHADRTGVAANNTRLSLRRAKLVRDQLLALGVDPTQIVISAFGPERRRFARVTVWGTRNSLESVVAQRERSADAIIWRYVESRTVVGSR